ncbi:Superoxide dismutase-like protein [Burkholderia gladioli BSR3]|jgi:Fe-Mn family superoxide dismutase|uniref:Superoxide dismutase n=1 Tax=Burkholderia gladioli (strain BSR3) TaxID=999541 RepID=F2LCA6_BURGS|nr:superoxide dismutase [Burkholderia gladioli]AEA59914.1 Superoxide dismutase-like protein [Burkholderia gladioli BSR3]MBW5286266.1 superoxide dismutase [Burkholderia gladioli]MDN7755235.1 superoxide dismutase [Burkholderia gladioli]PRH28166.1 superoxide dismutase [Burkholderia gladioli]
MLNSNLSRRRLLGGLSFASLGLALSRVAFGETSRAETAGAGAPVLRTVPAFLGSSPQTLPPLPYAENALEPTISARTIGFHYGKHHRAYFDNLHKLLAGTPLQQASLEQLIMQSHGVPEMADVFNNAAQAWNHNFYWNSLAPEASAPSEKLKAAIERKFGSMEALTKALVATSASQFGSGWGWLVLDGGELAVVKTGNAETPFTRGAAPLLTVDVWEHAYYLDYQNRRPDYLVATVSRHLNWAFASANFERV